MRVAVGVCLDVVFLVVFGCGCGVLGKIIYIGPAESNDVQFLRALEDQRVDRIVFTSDYSAGHQFDVFDGQWKEGMPIIKIHRSITITGEPGKPRVLLDLQFLVQVVELCDACTFTLEDIDIANERKGANAQIDFFLGAGNSVINLTNVNRYRLSCTPIEPALRLVSRTSRAPEYPAADASTDQIVGEQDVTFRGKVYPRSLHLIDYSAQFPKHYNGGYNVVLKNVTRVCQYFVDIECLKKMDSDVCVNEHISDLLARQNSAGTPQLSTGALAGIVVAAVCVAAVIAAALFHYMRRRDAAAHKDTFMSSKRHTAQVPEVNCKNPDDDFQGPPSSATASCPSVDPPVPKSEGGTQCTNTSSSSSNVMSAAAAHHDLPSSSSSCDLRFGPLLGSGSFGRVYKARWLDQDVAVKVIDHDSRMTAAVANEVQLMLSCNHPNIVRAYHYITIDPARNKIGGLPLKPLMGSLNLAVGSAVSSTGKGPNNSMISKVPDHTLDIVQQLIPRLKGGGTSPAGVPARCGGVQEQQLPCIVPVQFAGHNQNLQKPSALLPRQGVNANLPAADKRQLAMQQAGTSQDGAAVVFGKSLAAMQDDADWQSEMQKTWLIQEFCDCGTLSKMSNSWLPTSEGDAQMLVRLALLQDVVRGLAYLHGESVAHGDLNARNVLVASSSSSICGYMAKLADLGLSRTIKQHTTHHTTCTVGTMSHMPPELLRHGRMSTAVDIYSLGIMMYELYTREAAFRELHYGQFYDIVVLQDLRPQIPPSMPADYKLLMERCWAREPAERPDANTLLDCLSLLIAERQRNLGLPATGSSSVEGILSTDGSNGGT